MESDPSHHDVTSDYSGTSAPASGQASSAQAYEACVNFSTPEVAASAPGNAACSGFTLADPSAEEKPVLDESTGDWSIAWAAASMPDLLEAL